MPEKKPTSASRSSPTDSREALLQAALSVFASKGFEGTTVKDLADEAGVNVSLVSYHFGGKEGLYKTCIENFGIRHVEASERILRGPSSQGDLVLRLKMFAEEMIDTFNDHPDACKIINRGMDTLDPITLESFKSVFIRTFAALHGFIESGQRAGFVKKDLDTEILTQLMFGSLMHLNRSRDIARFLGKRTLDEPVYRAQAIDHWVRSHAEGMIAP